MAHLDPERLAQYALGDDTTLDAADQGHLAGCDQCRTEVEELRQLADLGHELTAGDRLEPAPPQVWDRIVEELQLPAGAAATSLPPTSLPPAPGRTGLPSAPPAPHGSATGGSASTTGGAANGRAEFDSVAPTDRPGLTALPGGAGTDQPGGTGAKESGPGHRRRDRGGRGRFVLVGAVAATVGLIAGVLGTQILDNDPEPAPQPLATTKLEPLEGKAGEGTAELVREGPDLKLRVGVGGLTSSPGFYELWLLNKDGKGMQSLGILDPRTGGTFLVPGYLRDQGYSIVDVSLEPNDGDSNHSTVSVVRGTLPA